MFAEKRFNLFTLCIHLGQVHAILACSFTERSGNFNAAVKFEMMPGSEELCLTACYEEIDCIFVDYFQGLCTVYKNGNGDQVGQGKVFEIDRQTSRSFCTRRIVVEATVNFETISTNKTGGSTCDGSPKSATMINMFKGVNDLLFYTTNGTMFSDGTPALRRVMEYVAKVFFRWSNCYFNSINKDGNPYHTYSRSLHELIRGNFDDNIFCHNSPLDWTIRTNMKIRLEFATNAQENCTSIPVFTRANHRRLYFGDVYNVTGYIFLSAYAFAERCVCESNACCGMIPIKEFLRGHDNYFYAHESRSGNVSDVDQTFYIVMVHQK